MPTPETDDTQTVMVHPVPHLGADDSEDGPWNKDSCANKTPTFNLGVDNQGESKP